MSNLKGVVELEEAYREGFVKALETIKETMRMAGVTKTTITIEHIEKTISLFLKGDNNVR